MMLLTSCTTTKYNDYDVVATTVVDKEMRTELNPITEILFGYQSTIVVYTLVVQYEGNKFLFNVNKEDYFFYTIGDTYWVKLMK